MDCDVNQHKSQLLLSQRRCGEQNIVSYRKQNWKMAESNDQSKSDISVSIDNLEDIMLPRLNRLSPAQWTLLSQGIRDSHITSIMADIVVNIYKQSVENSLKILAPVFEQNMATTSYVKSEVPLKTVSVHLTSLISTEIATILQVSPEVCRSGVELNSLMEEEVSRKVTAFANAIQKAPDYPVEPAVYVSGCFSNLINFNKMVSNTIECLQKDLNRVGTKCVEKYWTEFTSKWASGVLSPKPEVPQHDVSEKGVSQRIKSLISLPSICENISEIIEKYTHDSCDAKTSDNAANVLPTIDPFKTDEVTEEICQTILEDLHYCKSHGPVGQTEKTCPCTPHFNLKKIAGYVKDFYSSNLKADPVEKQELISKPEYSRFVEQQFTDMVSSLQKLMDSSDIKVVKLKYKPHRLKRVLFSLLPGCIPDVSSDEESPKPLHYTETDYFPKLDFQAVKPKIVSLCAECMENPDLQESIKMFKRDLTDKLYVHIMKKHYHKIPVPPKGKCLSDCVLSCKKIRDISGKLEISPEIIYVRVEDSVGTFFQNIFLWIRNEETDHITHSDRVSNVLSEINDMVGQLCPSLDKRQLEDEWDSMQVIGSAFTDPIDLDKDQIYLKPHTDSLVLVLPGSPTKMSSAHRFILSRKIATHVDDKIQTNVKYPESIETIEQANKELEEAMACFVMSAVLDCLKENGGPLEFKEMTDILSSVSGEKVDRVADFADSIDSKKIKHFVNEIYNDLKKQFGSTEAVWDAATSQAGRPFMRAVLRYLRSRNPNKPQKYPISRFFSVITKPFRKLF